MDEAEILFARMAASRQAFSDRLLEVKAAKGPTYFEGFDADADRNVVSGNSGDRRVVQGSVTNGYMQQGQTVKQVGRGLNARIDSMPRVKPQTVTVGIPEITTQRIIAMGDFMWLSDGYYTGNNLEFGRSLWEWLGEVTGKTVLTFSTASISPYGDFSIDDATYFSNLHADFAANGFTLNTISVDCTLSEFEASLGEANIFFAPYFSTNLFQIPVDKAEKLADFAREKNGVFFGARRNGTTYYEWTGIQEVFGVNNQPVGSFGVVPFVSPLPEIATFVTVPSVEISAVHFYAYMFPATGTGNTLYQLFESPADSGDPARSLAYLIELAE